MANSEELRAIQEAIASSGHTWTAGFTSLNNLSEEERRNYLGYVPGPNEPSLEEQEQIAAANLDAYQANLASNEAIMAPASIDWRNVNGQNFVTGVKNQGGCGSCVAFGTVAAVESRLKIIRGAAYPVDLSEAHLFYCIARSQGRTCGGSSGGWWPGPAMDGFRDIGVTDETCYPYTAGDQNCTGRCADWANRVTKISGYTRLTNIADMKDWISKNGPMEACFTVYDDFYSYKSGVYKKTSNKLEGGHCVCIIGYDDGAGCWIAKNSWGTGWGDNGFFRIGYGQCGIDSEMMGANSIVDTRWINTKKVVGLWTKNEERNAWAYLSDEGWKKISNNNDDGFINTLTQLATAKITNADVNVYVDNGLITTAYVF
ncbi:C1 family peptidase [Spirosoma oryzicola]|uniref:C1 family peptidase n=1 Tax=Spirosoma oryzicola TaxID=2898794 RepID=UPI001E495996|nr:C1 family peptidase [Spirosoma oryzicola]UHG90295.1 C1 family peptidase [Spirosoma oryzicola]